MIITIEEKELTEIQNKHDAMYRLWKSSEADNINLRKTINAFVDLVDESLLLDEKLAEDWDVLRQGVVFVRNSLEAIGKKM